MFASPPTRVAVRHGNAVVSAGLMAVFREQLDFEVSDGDGLDDAMPGWAPDATPDVVVTDYLGGLMLAAHFRADRALKRAPRVMIVTWQGEEWEIRAALQEGIEGYMLIDCHLDEMIHGVRALGRGMRYLCVPVAQRIAESVSYAQLTERETQVMGLMAEGHGNKDIAAELQVSVGTIKSHVKAILGKLHASSRTEASMIASRRGILREKARPTLLS
jgi:two-component system response regulator DesR